MPGLQRKVKVLIAPLDWGLGHASRDIEIIDRLINEGFEVIVASDNYPLKLLQEEFPNLFFIKFSSYSIKYSKCNLILKLIFQIPKILKGIIKEHKELKQVIKKYNIDVIISDCRYGFWNKSVKSVFITHQIMIKLPRALKIFEYFLYRINKLAIQRFDICWIPDNQKLENLSGDLSHKYKLPSNAIYIGLISRFNIKNNFPVKQISKKYDILIILSGPEPHRSILENKILEQSLAINYKCLLIRGAPGEDLSIFKEGDIDIISHLGTKEMYETILSSELIICRSGYTSIMDLVGLNKNAVIIPTPGQTEQEYLADYLNQKNIFYSVKQSEFDLNEILFESNNFKNNQSNFDQFLNKESKNWFKELIETEIQ